MAHTKTPKILKTKDGQLMFFKTDWFDETAWIRFGRALRSNQAEIERERGRLAKQDVKLVERRDEERWQLGDWLLAGKDGGIKVRKLKEHARVVFGQSSKEVSFATLNNYMTVCKTIEPSRRREKVPFSMHVLVAKSRFTVKQQDELLDYAEETIKNEIKMHIGLKGCLAVRTFDAYIESKFPTPVRPYEFRADEVVIDRKFVMKRKEVDFLDKVAKVNGQRSFIFAMRWMAFQYFSLHRDDFRTKINDLMAKTKAEEAEKERQQQYRHLVSQARDTARKGSWDPAAIKLADAAEAEFKAAHPLDTFVGKPAASPGEQQSFEQMFQEYAELSNSSVE
jgi:hypothetical protein